MKMLHNIFTKNFFKDWLIQFFAGHFLFIIGFVLVVASEANKDSGFFSTILLILGGLAICVGIFSPFMIVINNNKFNSNIHSLINQGFNRKELLQYSLVSTLVRFSLFLFHYFTLYLWFYAIQSNKTDANTTPVDNWVASSEVFGFILVTSFFSYLFTPFLNNKNYFFQNRNDEINRSILPKKEKRKFNKMIYLGIFIGALFVINYGDYISTFFLVSFFFLGFVSLMIHSTIKTFNLYNPDKKLDIQLKGAGLSVVFMFLMGFVFINNINNEDEHIKARTEDFIFVGKINSMTSNETKLKLLQSGYKYREMLRLVKDDIAAKDAVIVIKEYGHLRSFYKNYPKIDKSVTNIFIQKMLEVSKNSKQVKYKNRFLAFRSHLWYIKNQEHFNEVESKEFISSNDPLLQYMGLYLLGRGKNKEEYAKEFEQLKNSIDNDVAAAFSRSYFGIQISDRVPSNTKERQ